MCIFSASLYSSQSRIGRTVFFLGGLLGLWKGNIIFKIYAALKSIERGLSLPHHSSRFHNDDKCEPSQALRVRHSYTELENNIPSAFRFEPSFSSQDRYRFRTTSTVGFKQAYSSTAPILSFLLASTHTIRGQCWCVDIPLHWWRFDHLPNAHHGHQIGWQFHFPGLCSKCRN